MDFLIPLFAARLNELWYALPLIVAISIVYAGTRREAETVATYLRDVLKRPAEHYHAALDPVTRARVQDAFLSGDLPLVVAGLPVLMVDDWAEVTPERLRAFTPPAWDLRTMTLAYWTERIHTYGTHESQSHRSV